MAGRPSASQALSLRVQRDVKPMFLRSVSWRHGVFAMQRCEPEKFARPFSTLLPLCYR
jgi:hypothetical protein